MLVINDFYDNLHITPYVHILAWQFIDYILYKGLAYSWIMESTEALEITPWRFQGVNISGVIIPAAERH